MRHEQLRVKAAAQIRRDLHAPGPKAVAEVNKRLEVPLGRYPHHELGAEVIEQPVEFRLHPLAVDCDRYALRRESGILEILSQLPVRTADHPYQDPCGGLAVGRRQRAGDIREDGPASDVEVPDAHVERFFPSSEPLDTVAEQPVGMVVVYGRHCSPALGHAIGRFGPPMYARGWSRSPNHSDWSGRRARAL